jgi:alkylation response protein AidB-like acyl-CoA dehydrogenase
MAEQNIDRNTLPDEAFRAQLRQFLAAHYPAHLRQDTLRPFRRIRATEMVDWLKVIRQHGWRCPDWPRESGGMGLSFRKLLIYHEELERAGVSRIIDFGEAQLGPTLIQMGTPAQKAYYLPRILDCEDLWCQGYSEPNAGSDLASLRTRAERDGEEFVVNGQKIWTTHASDSTHIFVLVRTGQYEKRQKGISFLLMDLRTPGITVRPIHNLAGEDEFCEVFFDNVRVPANAVVGTVDEGWTVAKALLGHERIWLGIPTLVNRAFDLSCKLVRERGLEHDTGVFDRLAALAADLHDYRLLYAHISNEVAESGRAPGPEASVLKIYVTELLQRLTQFNAEIAAEYGGVIGAVQVGDTAVDLHWQMMMARPGTIFGGCNEVQRDILAKSVLRLPV